MKATLILRTLSVSILFLGSTVASAKGGKAPSGSRPQGNPKLGVGNHVKPKPKQPKPKSDRKDEPKKEKTPETSSTPYLYADTGVLSPKGVLTVRRIHPAEVAGLKQVRKRGNISVEGIGFSLGRETVFRNNVAMMKTSFYSSEGLTGSQLLKQLENYSAVRCIPRLLIAGHGYGSPLASSSLDAIAKNSEWRDAGKGFYLKGPGFSVEGTLKEQINRGQIRFCSDQCEIYLHACSISQQFASSLAKVTGCHVIASDYKVSPVSPTYGESVIKYPTTTLRKFPNNGEYEQVWFTSSQGNFWEYLPTGSRKKIGQTFIFDPNYLLR